MQRYLLFDAGCAVCNQLARTIRGGGRGQVRTRKHPRAAGLEMVGPGVSDRLGVSAVSGDGGRRAGAGACRPGYGAAAGVVVRAAPDVACVEPGAAVWGGLAGGRGILRRAARVLEAGGAVRGKPVLLLSGSCTQVLYVCWL